MTAVCVAALGVVGTGSAVARPMVPAPEPLEQVLVLPGDTLWSLAADVDPGADRRDVIQEIMRINDLSTSGVMAGQTLLLPAA